MILVRRGNVELEVAEAYLNSYLAKGYDRVDTEGNVISKGTPNDMTSLKLAYAQSQNLVNKLTEENIALVKENGILQKQLEELNKKPKGNSKLDK